MKSAKTQTLAAGIAVAVVLTGLAVTPLISTNVDPGDGFVGHAWEHDGDFQLSRVPLGAHASQLRAGAWTHALPPGVGDAFVDVLEQLDEAPAASASEAAGRWAFLSDSQRDVLRESERHGPDSFTPSSPRQDVAANLFRMASAERLPTPTAADLASLALLDPAVQDALSVILERFLDYQDATRRALAHVDIDAAPAPDAWPDRALLDDAVGAQPAFPKATDAQPDWNAVVDEQWRLVDASHQLQAALREHAPTAAAPIQLAPLLSIDMESSDNTYNENFALLIDAGGNDKYLNNAGAGCLLTANPTFPVAAFLLDQAGNDQYANGPSDPVNTGCRAATGLIGSGTIVDLAGTDAYYGGNAAAGSGTGFLFDDGVANDLYEGSMGGISNTFGNAVVFDSGIAILIDAGGDDRYDAGTYGQAAALFNGGGSGFAFLRDKSGSDVYRAEYGNGVARLSGAILWDDEGNDLYTGPVTSSSGWTINGGGFGAVGLLMDRAGNDVYTTNFMGNGVGQAGLGVLLDEAGDDAYTSPWGNAARLQQAGNAVLVDRDGNDVYRNPAGYWRLGVGNSWAFQDSATALIDQAGNDVYSSDREGNGLATRGLALLVDQEGTDSYTEAGVTFTEQSRAPKGAVGVQLDLPHEPTDPPDGPDLLVSSLTSTPSDPIEGDIVTFSATVANQGTQAAGASSVDFTIDGASIGTVSFSGLAAGASTTVTKTWASTEGSHDAGAEADSSGQVAETDESNNGRTVSVSVDPEVAGVALSPDSQSGSVKPRKSISYDVTVTNSGNRDDTVKLSLSANSGGWKANLSKSSLSLAAGASAVVKVTVRAPSSGSSFTVTLTGTSSTDTTVKDTTTMTTTLG